MANKFRSVNGAKLEFTVDKYVSFTIAVDDVTPSVKDGSLFVTSANTVVTAITNFDDAIIGQKITIIGGSNTNSSTIADGGNFNLKGGATLTLSAGFAFQFIENGGVFSLI